MRHFSVLASTWLAYMRLEMTTQTILTHNLDYLLFATLGVGLLLILHVWLWRTKRLGGVVYLTWALLLATLTIGWRQVKDADSEKRQQIEDMVRGFAPTYAQEMELMGHARLTAQTNAQDPLYLSMIAAEKRWLAVNPFVADIYTLRKTADGKNVLMVDSETDYDHNGKFEGDRESRTPLGEVYDKHLEALERAFQGQADFMHDAYTDRWGTWVSAFVPMHDEAGRVEGVLGVDYEAQLWQEAALHGRLEVIAKIATICVILIVSGVMLTVLRHDLIERRRAHAEIRTLNEQLEERVRQRTQELERVNDALRAEVVERKEAEEDLRRTNERLQTAQASLMQADKMETVGRLAASVAHEVKNPLAVIAMGIEYLSADYPANGDQNVPTVLSEMQNSVQRADTIIRGLLDFSASSRWDAVDENLNSAIEQSLQLVRHDLVKSHVNVTTELADNLPSLKLNRGKMEQVFINLFINAVHAMPRGGTLTIRTRAQSPQQHKGSQDGASVVTEVMDTGTGIPPEALSKIFEPFFTTKPTGVGTGLGLPVVKNIIELHGGTITMGNRPAGGAVATITFNLKGNN
jgi:signal transduction histidine kinase